MLATAPHVTAIVARDCGELWDHVTPESSRRLLMAALEAFATLGFEGATTREIAGRAQMSPAAVYVHYKAKLDLLQEICEVAHRAVWATVGRRRFSGRVRHGLPRTSRGWPGAGRRLGSGRGRSG